MPVSLSNLDLINSCDQFPYLDPSKPQEYFDHLNKYVHLRVVNQPRPEVTFGLIRPEVAEGIAKCEGWELDTNSTPSTLTLVAGSTADERNVVVDRSMRSLREARVFQVLDKWREELYTVYGVDKRELFAVERSASPLLGVVTYGVHMTAYKRHPSGMRIWVPRRSAHKQTYPSMLDNTVAGGMAKGELPYEALIREASEEADLPESLVRDRVVAVGAITYLYERDSQAGGECGLLQPECQYLYDMDLTDSGAECAPNDDEVESFKLMEVAAVKSALRNGEFKPNCAMVMLDFLLRHGHIVMEDEPDYGEIVARLHRRLEFPMR
ncbi:hypothetical protein EJ06DRAFT_469314 [Trichodelitschia bisporula]|uniref:Nudix hydrolase domain-containing protein n=1 Tax=Trichodelitschia bisporula TaxID=703511 RepID=A0A6G1IB35_9PEZI|nr:hypothetical protein EJ06DRAFT_469314 [Trichodelitschia bisporula]